MASIKEFLYLLEVEPFWPILILLVLILSALYPYKIRGKSITKKDEDGNEETTYFEYRF